MQTREYSNLAVVLSDSIYNVNVLFALGQLLRSKQRIAYEQYVDGLGLACLLDMLVAVVGSIRI